MKVGDLVRVRKENMMIAVDPIPPGESRPGAWRSSSSLRDRFLAFCKEEGIEGGRDCLDNKLAIISSLPSPTSKLSICSVIPLGQKEPVPVLMEYLYPVSIEEQLAKEIGDMTDEEVEENVKKYFR